MVPRVRHLFEFGSFQLDSTDRTLLRDGRPVQLPPKVFDTLLVLVQNSGRTVQKDELIRQVWPDTFVEENNLNKNVSVLRKLLGEQCGEPHFIETVPKRGYRFVPGVREIWADGRTIPKPAANPVPGAGEERPETFVGREPELKRLCELMEGAVSGSGRVAFVTGEAGIGKTALVGQFLRRARTDHPDMILGIGRCVEQYGAGEAYLPVLDALGGLFSGAMRDAVASVLRSAAPTWCLQFPAIFGSSETLEHLRRETFAATKERMLREMGEALEMISAGSPAILLLEDLQWADSSSTDLIRLLCRRIGGQRLLVIGTYPPDEVELKDHPLKNCKREMLAHGECEEIGLEMLSRNDVALLLDLRFAPNGFPPEFAGLIRQKTEGHPLFTTSLVQYLLERGSIARLNGTWGLAHALSEMNLEVPESAKGMIRKKVDALDAEDRRALEYASIEGEEFTSNVLAGLLDADELALQERLDRIRKAHHIVQTVGEETLPDRTVTTRYRFSHVLYQNLLYEELVPRRRMLLHLAAGEELVGRYGDQAPRIAGQIAMHFERGKDYGRAVKYLTHAGDNAISLYANSEAEERYSQALRLVESLAPDARSSQYLTLYQKRGLANFALSRFDRAVDDFTKMTDEARAIDSPVLECTALNALSHVLFFTHRSMRWASGSARR
jgi:predicted ATPase/DNA-binding winged helix-turn-helix (wHTH) protein